MSESQQTILRAGLEGDGDAYELPVRELMTSDVECVRPDEPISVAAKRMAEMRISCIVVTDEAGRPNGILTERDLARVTADPHDYRVVGDAMTAPVQTISGDRTLSHAYFEISRRSIRRLVVVGDDLRVVGVVTQTDLVRAYVERLESLVYERTRALHASNEELKRLTRADPLLGIGNRHALKEDLQRTHAIAARHYRPYSLAILDLDNFKQVNDQHGHAAGDATLKGVCERISATLRTSDALYRMGGDEFILMLPETDVAGARLVTERVREAIQYYSAELGGVTLSAGVVTFRVEDSEGDAMDPWDLVKRADAALYEAKAAGRNRVQVG